MDAKQWGMIFTSQQHTLITAVYGSQPNISVPFMFGKYPMRLRVKRFLSFDWSTSARSSFAWWHHASERTLTHRACCLLAVTGSEHCVSLSNWERRFALRKVVLLFATSPDFRNVLGQSIYSDYIRRVYISYHITWFIRLCKFLWFYASLGSFQVIPTPQENEE